MCKGKTAQLAPLQPQKSAGMAQVRTNSGGKVVSMKIGIPNGSLIDQNRGGLKRLLDNARIYVDNLGTNAPARISNIPWLDAITGRPQELPGLAAQGYCDIFFCGSDWVREWELMGKKSIKLLDLGIGGVSLVCASGSPGRRMRTLASEYPRIAREYLADCLAAKGRALNPDDIPIVPAGCEIPKDGPVVVSSFGATEAKAYSSLVDGIIEATQSGSTLSNYSLYIKETVMVSECGLYMAERAAEPAMMKQADRVRMMLQGAVNARDTDIVLFNVPNGRLDEVIEYIRDRRLFAEEETVKPGALFSEITLQLPTKDRTRPLVDIIGDLTDMGACSVDGVALSYSVK